MTQTTSELLYFWAIGDLHFRALPAWNEVHAQRLAPMFEDLHTLWQEEGKPAFCVSPGDLVETCALENYITVATSLNEKLGDVPFYPGVGNHEYFAPDGEDFTKMVQTFNKVWQRPIRYSWTINGVTCIMLDYPNPYTLKNPDYIYVSDETLAFLEETLTRNADNPAHVILHCPLRNTVLERDAVAHTDYSSLENFFSPENSQEVREVLANHKNACLCFSGHTHSGWEAPQLVVTERLGGHPMTFVNLMSPWYTGTKTGIRLSEENTKATYVPDAPDVIPTFAVRMYRDKVTIRVRDHRTRRWLKEWQITLRERS